MGSKVTILSGVNCNELFFKQMMKYDDGGCYPYIWGGGMWGGGSMGGALVLVLIVNACF